MPELKMVGCSARGVTFEGAGLRKADLRDTDFSEAAFAETDLRGADLRSARGYAIDARTNRLKGARVSLPEGLGLLAALEIKSE